MARVARSEPVDFSRPQALTNGLIERMVCPPGKNQAFLRDLMTPGLLVRVAPTGAKSFVFERKVGQKTVRRSIGSVQTWSLLDAKEEARRIYAAMDQGADIDAVMKAKACAQETEIQGKSTALEVWQEYLADRKKQWGERHYKDHEKMVSAGGVKARNHSALTKPGLLRGLLDRPLNELTPEVVERWAAEDAARTATQGRLAVRMLGAFLNWCQETPAYRDQVVNGSSLVKTRRVRETLGKAKAKNDSILKEQLPAWFEQVRAYQKPAVSAYLQVSLLIGARPNEVRHLRWTDIDWHWKKLTINDKVEGSREIPLTPYVASLLASLPRVNEWVFANPDTADGAIMPPNDIHNELCTAARIDPVTLHGIRRSFKSLSEWLDMPTGVVAQLMGHKPSATAEKHYTVRPLDLLRVHHERIERWVLEQAGVPFVG